MTDGIRRQSVDQLPPAARNVQGLRAGLISRLIAGAIDYLTVALLTAGTYVGFVLFRFLLDPRNYRLPDVAFSAFVGVGLLLMVLYLWTCWATYGRTVGNRVVGLRVVGRHGNRVHWFMALVRSLACTFFPIGMMWCAISRENRSLQDIVLRTSVIHDWPTAIADVQILNSADRRLDLDSESTDS
jgi:uncharacterized RDD family membrane protein YckC